MVDSTQRYKAYPEYKDSGVEWLGEIPSGWNKSLLKHYLLSMTGGGTPDSSSESNWTDSGEGIPWVSIADITRSFEIKNTIKDVTRKGLLSKNLKVLPVDTVLYSIYASLGKVAVTKVPLVTNQAILGLETCKQLDSGFLVFWLIHIQPLLSLYSTSNTQENLNAEKVGNLPLYIPSLIEQKRISSFLDYETAKIDILIEKQKRLIELLIEKRQAVISHTVSKGLNPDVTMKGSGVEWLGEVPEHWEVKSYRHASEIYRGKFGHRPRNDPAFYDGEYPFIQTGDVARADKVITSYSQTLNEKGKSVSQLFPKGTLVMAIAANIGDIAILGFESYAPDSVVGFKPYKNIDLEFLRYSFMGALPALEQTSTQSTQANLNVDRIGAVKGVFPPLSEQIQIVSKLDSLLEFYTSIETKANQQIQLMQERRTALISAAVTGKIDVRDWKVPVASGVYS